MSKTQLRLNMEKEFWCIVESGDVKGYHTGKADVQINLFQFDTASEMMDFLGDGSVESGESMGDYIFRQLAISHKWEILNQIIESEKQEQEMEQ